MIPSSCVQRELQAVADLFGLEPEIILSGGKHKTRILATARAVFCHVMQRRGANDGEVSKLLNLERSSVVKCKQIRPLSIALPEVERVERLLDTQPAEVVA